MTLLLLLRAAPSHRNKRFLVGLPPRRDKPSLSGVLLVIPPRRLLLVRVAICVVPTEIAMISSPS